MKINGLLIIISLFIGYSFSSDWMDLIPDARSSGMGGISIAMPYNNFSGYSNPAIGAKKSGAAYASYRLFEDTNYTHLNLNKVTDFGNTCIGLAEISDPGYQRTVYVNSRPQIIGDNFSVGSREIYINSSFKSKNGVLPFDFGITGRYLLQQIAESYGAGYCIDVGMLWQPLPFIYLGAVEYNLFQPNMKWLNSYDPQIFPQKTKVGMSIVLPFLIVGAEYYMAGYQEQRLSYGTEAILFNFLALRAGMNRDNFTAGLGLNLFNLSFDLAYTPAVADILQENWRFSCSLGF